MTVKVINVHDLKKMLENEEDFHLVDCREQGEWDEGHIPTAEFMPLSTFAESSKTLDLDKKKLIVMQCRSGKRSLNACMQLLDRGFTNLANLEGGIMDWAECGYKIVKD
jgi:rhodanese-related sulfurtransferase